MRAVRFFETQAISKHVFTKAETDLMICRHCREVIFKKKTLQVGKKKERKFLTRVFLRAHFVYETRGNSE